MLGWVCLAGLSVLQEAVEHRVMDKHRLLQVVGWIAERREPDQAV
jgi:hypothetical protein